MKQKIVVTALMLFAGTILNANYYSQHGQDQYLNEHIFKGKRDGVFVDIGAHDGITLSNTYFFETQLGWTGLCVEPIPRIFEKLSKNRSSICVQGCIADHDDIAKFLSISGYCEMLSGLLSSYDHLHLERIGQELQDYGGKKEIIETQCYRLNALLDQYNISHVDYLSIDTEGSELEILKDIDFSKIDIDIITVENNYKTQHIENLLKEKGYELVAQLGCDEVFRKVRS
jgi:FkbM family methyltransferase